MKNFLIVVIFFSLSLFSSCKDKVNTQQKYVLYQKGEASWYGPGFNGKKTASGEVFDMNKLTAAHRTLKFGTVVRVTNLRNSKQVEVVINDRGPATEKRIIDLSKRAAQEIGLVEAGVGKVTIEIIK